MLVLIRAKYNQSFAYFNHFLAKSLPLPESEGSGEASPVFASFADLRIGILCTLKVCGGRGVSSQS